MMDMNGKECNVRGSDDPVNYHEPNFSSDWQVNGNNLSNTSMGMIPIGTESCSRVVDSFCLPIWEQTNNGQSLGYCDMNVQNDATDSSTIGRIRNMDWTSSANTMLRAGVMPAVSGMIPHFGGGDFGKLMNPFGVPDSMLPYFRGAGLIDGESGVSVGHMNMIQAPEDALPNESDEAECSGHGVQMEQNCAADESPRKGLGCKKRKRGGQDTEHDNKNIDSQKPSVDMVNSASISKQGGSQGSDQPKDEYIHVRARRGQATNSHSLAERVRREKISERMKLLQDLVPGCSKVTGKAVMLDEIINYVQSLQRQVEFLSMKLATVNPRLDANIEAFLTKDISRTMSSPLAFTPGIDMPFSIPGLLPGSSETIRRQPTNNIQSAAVCGGYKGPASQAWEDELHNIVHMGFGSNVLHNNQDISGRLTVGHMKAEL